jgi:uncharacterized protein (TIGR00725 family)
MRKLQIGVMGSAADLGYSEQLAALAQQLGAAIAQENAALVFGAEKDVDSLSTIAARAARQQGGLTVGITYGKGMDVFGEQPDIVIASGLERGGGREFALVLSCDAIITLGGGSGTLTEMLVAYQADIPIVALQDTGGWSEKLQDQYMDGRQRRRVVSASTPQDALRSVFDQINEKQTRLKAA